MILKINGKRIFYTAIESMWYSRNAKAVIIRTVSGYEGYKSVKSEEKANAIMDEIESMIALSSSL